MKCTFLDNYFNPVWTNNDMILAILDGSSQECLHVSEDLNYIKSQMSSLNIKCCRERPGVVRAGSCKGDQPRPRRKAVRVVCAESNEKPMRLE